ncbi:MAG: tetratricopeptide repeat protein [Acidobacteriia bacterium]|nr:tetratricopeptide repeat protein [Terriglobia bacterium]
MAESRTSSSLGLILLLAVAVWTFRSSLGNPFHFDDNLFLQSPQVTEPGDPWYLLKPTQTRQLTYLTFYWNYRAGAMSPVGYHLVNLLLHLANALSLYWFARLLMRRRTGSFDPLVQRWLPLAAAGIFALHPVQTEAVNYIYQRSTLLAAFFSLISMASFLQAQLSQNRRTWFALSGFCFFLAAASKEAALILPLIWAALVWAESGTLKTFRQHLVRWRSIVAVLTLAGLAAVWALYNLWGRGERTTGLALMGGSLQYLLAQFQVLATYLRLLLFPAGLSIDHDFQPAPPASPTAILCVIMLCALVFFAVRMRRFNPTLSFLVLAFLLFLAPTSSIVPSKDLLFEHRLYLPMTAAAILIAWGIFAAIHRFLPTDRLKIAVGLACVSLLLGCYAIASERRTYIWGDGVRLWEDAVAKAPRKARAHYNLAIAYLDRDRQKARQELLVTVELDPNHAAALYNLGWLAQIDGSLDTAGRYYRAAIHADPKTWQAHHNLGNLNLLQGDLQDARREFEETIRERPDYWPAYLNLAALQVRMGDTRAALQTLQFLIRFHGDLLEARYLRAYALVLESRFEEAQNELSFIAERDSAGTYRSRIAELRRQFPARTKSSR